GKRALVIRSEDPTKPVTLEFAFAGETDNPLPFWAGLTVEGGTVVFKNVHFRVEAHYTPPQLVAAVVVKGGQVTFERCAFSQDTPSEALLARRNLVPIASVAAWNPGWDKPPVMFRQCWFARGQAAVSVKGAARVDQVHCAFGAHACLFHV